MRIGYWFLNTANTSCYNQGDRPAGVADPYCQPLVIETVGPMGGSVSFTVELQPSLPAGDYSIKRMIDIDPNEEWVNYGQEEVDTVTVTEDLDIYGIKLQKTGEQMPSSSSEGSSSSGSSSGGGGGSSGGSSIIEKIITPITNIYQNITNIILPQEEKQSSETENKNNKEKTFTETEPKSGSSGLELITGAGITSLIGSLSSHISLTGMLIFICLILSGLVGYYYAKSKKKES